MSWINDLPSVFGLPAGGATIAAALYAACAAAEKTARPEALHDIARFLTDREWSRATQPSEVIRKVFNHTFGEHHLSLKCVSRSMAATLVFVASIVLTVYLETGVLQNLDPDFWILLVLMGFPSDYIALWKTRYLLSVKLSPQFLLIFDVFLSIFISSVLFVIVIYIIDNVLPSNLSQSFRPTTFWQAIEAAESNWISLIHLDFGFFIPPIMFTSTLLTSFWIILVVLSTVVLKIASPIQGFTT
jgi:hypothetical protein